MPRHQPPDSIEAAIAPDALRARIVDWARSASLEISARDRQGEDAVRDLLDPGTTIYINYAAGDTHHGVVGAAARLRRGGFNPVPHIAARSLSSIAQLDDLLAGARQDADIDQVLVIAGDVEHPLGPFHDSGQLLATGLLEKHGIRRVGIAGYPEGHPTITRETLAEALQGKLGLARKAGLEIYVVTQFGFEAKPIADWLRRFRADGVGVPVRVGLAGPASIATLAKFAIRCGIGASIRTLTKGHSSVTRLLVEAGPERIMRSLVLTGHALGIEGLHLFTFGGTARSAAWLRALQDGNFTLGPAGEGFRVVP